MIGLGVAKSLGTGNERIRGAEVLQTLATSEDPAIAAGARWSLEHETTRAELKEWF
jgi:hypothetical protein